MATFQTYRVRTLRINKQEQVKLKQGICVTFEFQPSDVSIRKVSKGSLKESLFITVKLLKNDRFSKKSFLNFLLNVDIFGHVTVEKTVCSLITGQRPGTKF